MQFAVLSYVLITESYVFCWICADDPDKFTIHLEHNGFFCGRKENLCYVDGSVDFWDYCNTDSFSLLWIEEFIKQGGNELQVS